MERSGIRGMRASAFHGCARCSWTRFATSRLHNNQYLPLRVPLLPSNPPARSCVHRIRAFLPDTRSSGRCMRPPPDPAEAAGLHGSYTTLSAPISACACTDCRRQPRQIGSSAVTLCHDSTKDKRTKVRVLMPDTHCSGRCTDCPPLALRGRNSWAKSNHGG